MGCQEKKSTTFGRFQFFSKKKEPPTKKLNLVEKKGPPKNN
jgi:hypothetical protein